MAGMTRYVIVAILVGAGLLFFVTSRQLAAEVGLVGMVLGARVGWSLTRRETDWFAAYGPCFLCAFSIGGFLVAVIGHTSFLAGYGFAVFPSLVFAAPAALLATAPKRSHE
jgi:hypothetical protein